MSLTHESTGRKVNYTVSNSGIVGSSKVPGIAFRSEKSLQAKIPGSTALWNSTVRGTDEGDGWICTDVGYLPIFVNGTRVLHAQEAEMEEEWDEGWEEEEWEEEEEEEEDEDLQR
eukprot:gnl/TRDRNA2_/TRDRNA2_83368_c0_seq1.p1 gnl/TRDRNA2_/TRDRNA2_83368_c0~~gnl/TRDRNA2_/TRDRNA2_83368_c0_seq1.p1  ORF type:complete len:115 (-),score=30.63 gnl/TRDRNA2_/TRDRNA2_83368_c0_seq1:987-1331(-)